MRTCTSVCVCVCVCVYLHACICMSACKSVWGGNSNSGKSDVSTSQHGSLAHLRSGRRQLNIAAELLLKTLLSNLMLDGNLIDSILVIPTVPRTKMALIKQRQNSSPALSEIGGIITTQRKMSSMTFPSLELGIVRGERNYLLSNTKKHFPKILGVTCPYIIWSLQQAPALV